MGGPPCLLSPETATLGLGTRGEFIALPQRSSQFIDRDTEILQPVDAFEDGEQAETDHGH